MSSAARDIRNLTIWEFDDFVEADQSGREFELIDGELVMMSNPTEAHEQIAGNIGAPLKLAMNKRGCRTYQGGMRVQANDDKSGRDSYKPDVLVRCGPRDDKKTYVTDPVVIVEVLSPSTMDKDRGKKLEFYKTLPSVRHIVLVYSDQMRVEHYTCGNDGWKDPAPLTYPDETLNLEAVEFSLGMEEIYFDLPF